MSELAVRDGAGVAGEKSITWLVWLAGIGGSQTMLALFGGFSSPTVSALTVVAALVPSALVFLAAKQVPARRTLGLVGVVVSYCVSGLTAVISVNLVMLWAGAVAGIDFEQMLNGMIFFLWFQCLVAAFANHRSLYLASMKRLSAVRGQIASVANWRSVNLDITREAMVEKVVHQIEQAKVRIAAIIDDPKVISGISNDGIRPLLSEIDSLALEIEPPVAADEIPRVTKKRSFKTVFSLAMDGHPRLALIGALFIATTWALTGLSLSVWQVVVFATLAGGLGQFALLWLANRFILGLFRRWPLGARWLAVLPIWAVLSVIAAVVPIMIAGIPSYVVVAVGVQSAVVMLVISMVLSYRQAGDELRVQVLSENANLERALIENATQLRLFRERLRHFIHGDLQSAFVALERKLVKSGSISNADAHSLLDELNQVVAGINKRLDSDKPISVFDTVEEMKVIWQGILELSVEISDGAAGILGGSSITSSVLSELLIEVITNTAKHDSANAVSIQVSMLDADTVSIVSVGSATNQAQISKAVQGHGSRMYNEVCLNWSLTKQGSKTLFTALVPLVREAVAA